MRAVSSFFIIAVVVVCSSVDAFAPLSTRSNAIRTTGIYARNHAFATSLQMSDSEPKTADPEATAVEEEEEPMDEATRLQLEKQRKVEELKAQEVFIQRSTGKHECSNCGWEYDEEKGDSMMIGGMIKPGTPFSELPSNWRCPTCRASKDNFVEVTEEIPGFEVNQGYGFGGNSMTAGQKNTIIFGGLGLFFVLFLAGYGLS